MIPNRYVAKLSRKDKKKQIREILKSRRLYKKNQYYKKFGKKFWVKKIWVEKFGSKKFGSKIIRAKKWG
jgi:hypothetical protein